MCQWNPLCHLASITAALLLLRSHAWVQPPQSLVCRTNHHRVIVLLGDQNDGKKKVLSSSRLTVKPPPAANFDLQAIEAFEAQLDQQQARDDGWDDDGDDDDDDDLDPQQQQKEEMRTFTVDKACHGKRIDAALVMAFPDLSRSFCGNLVTDKRVSLMEDGNTPTDDMVVVDRKSFKVTQGQVLQIRLPPADAMTEIVAQDIPLDILYEDEHMIVINKAAHMVVHPAAGNWDGTVVNALAYYLAHKSPYGKGDFVTSPNNVTTAAATAVAASDNIAIPGTDGEPVNFRPGVVHRLDKGTTGVLVMAKTATALAQLSASFADRRVKKTYLAITVGNPGQRVVIDKPIGRHPIHRQRMRVVPNPHKHGILPETATTTQSTVQTGRRALSFVDTMAFDGRLSLVKVRIETGRTHQIRVHLSDRRTPIYGDDVYGLSDWNKKLKGKNNIERPLLHAYRLEIDHPVTGQSMVFEAPLADDMWRIARAICPPETEKMPSFLKRE